MKYVLYGLIILSLPITLPLAFGLVVAIFGMFIALVVCLLGAVGFWSWIG